jgi:cytochrome c peroxidase
MHVPQRRLSVLLTLCAAGALAILCAVALAAALVAAPRLAARDELGQQFMRPSAVLHPPDNAPSPEKIALGERLFREPRLSRTGTISCATCHDPKLAFADGQSISRAGTTGRPLPRHTPALWDLAWAPVLHWDGRAASLEEQAGLPIQHADEMASTLADAATRLSGEAEYRAAFRTAFPGTESITGDLIGKAIAGYERTLVSPPTRFDRWIAGEETALSADEQRGFALFTGKARCARCHSGFAFTDHAFHDTGLPGEDRGRGAVIGLAAADHAFKTPGLRELTWTAPYMHDGSLATLEDVIRHYERGGIVRPSRSTDMPPAFRLSDSERADLVAFLEALSSDDPPEPSTEPWVARAATAGEAPLAATNRVSQRDKKFSPEAIRLPRGATATVLNDDTRTHNVRIHSSAFTFDSGAQEPGEHVIFRLDHAGRFEAHCGIHPTMRLLIEVD